MRVFVAVEINRQDLLERINSLQTGWDGKAVEPHNMHFTLRFLGETPTPRVQEIVNALKTVRFESFAVTIRGIGAFKNRQQTVVWAGTDAKSGRLLEGLARKVDESLGLVRDRPFKPHLTLKRIRRGTIPDLEGLTDTVWGTQNVNVIKLKKSVLTRTGPIYTDVVEVGAC